MTGEGKNPSEAKSLQDIADAISTRFAEDQQLQRLAGGRDPDVQKRISTAVDTYVRALPETVAYSLVPVEPDASARSDVNFAISMEVLLLLEDMGREQPK